MNDPDIPNSFVSAIVVREHLRSIAESTKEHILARYLEAALNPTLRRRLVLNPPEGVKGSLLKAAASRLERTNELLDPAAVDRLYEETKLDLETRTDSEWEKLCIGREVLQRFHRNHVEGLDYEVFRNKVARKMRDLGRIPEPITAVMSAVTADLSRGAEVR
jgi:hypothetical protein